MPDRSWARFQALDFDLGSEAFMKITGIEKGIIATIIVLALGISGGFFYTMVAVKSTKVSPVFCL